MICGKFKDSQHAKCGNYPRIVCEQKRKKYELENSFLDEICKIRIDKGYINSTSSKLCDYLIVICTKKIAIFVELKGADFDKACIQLHSTIKLLSSDIRKFKYIAIARVVAQRIPNIATTKQIKLEKFLREINKSNTLAGKYFDKKSIRFLEKTKTLLKYVNNLD